MARVMVSRRNLTMSTSMRRRTGRSLKVKRSKCQTRGKQLRLRSKNIKVRKTGTKLHAKQRRLESQLMEEMARLKWSKKK